MKNGETSGVGCSLFLSKTMYHLDVATSQCQNTSAPFLLSTMSASLSSLLFFITTSTNLLVCLAILIDPNKKLRTQFNCFTFNLALADLIVGFIAEPVSVYAHIREAVDTKHKQEVKSFVLKLFHVPYFISEMASVLTIAALALERYLALTSPFHYRRYFNVQLSIILSTVIWIISFGFGLLNIHEDYILGSFIFVNTAVLLTGVVVCFASIRIRSTLRLVSNNWKQTGVQCTTEDNTQRKLTKTFALMIGVLMCCYVPACSMIYYMNLCQDCDCKLVQWFRDAAFWLVLLNSAINPFVYAIRSSSFRNAIRQITHCNCRREKEPQRKTLVKYVKKDTSSKESKSSHADYGSISTGSEEDSMNSERIYVI